MFGMFSVKRKVETPAEQKLEEIRNILFPPSSTEEAVDKETGDVLKYEVDYSADINLYGALIDIQEGYSDETVQNTVKDVHDRLLKIRKLLNSDIDWNTDESKYVVVDNKHQELDIIAAED